MTTDTTTSAVERFGVNSEWVRASDYDILAAENARLQVELDKLGESHAKSLLRLVKDRGELTRLRAASAASWIAGRDAAADMCEYWPANDAMKAFRGSLDAAVALLLATLRAVRAKG